MNDNQRSATAAEQSPNPLDPWLALRFKTANRNEILSVADGYARISRAALQQIARLKDKPKVKQETLETLASIVQFCDERSGPLFERVAKIDVELTEETERLNHD